MYVRKNSLKSILIILSCVFFAGLVLFVVKKEQTSCLGVPFITEEELQQIAYTSVEQGNVILLEDHLLPYDEAAKKLYITCNMDAGTKFYDMEGQLTSLLSDYKLYFLWDDAFEVMMDAIKYGYRFSLFAVDSNGNYISYAVIFTTLPVVEMRGEVVRVDEREREVYAGEITVWDPAYQESSHLMVQDSALEWNVRGFSSMSFQKKSLKLNLKEKNGQNNKLAFLGFESDDDYILNPMWFDDIKVREKLAIDLWNEMSDEKGSTLKMSDGQFCEVVINGEYQGLRLMQNKIEKSYLKLDDNDILLKGNNVNEGTKKSPEEVYETIFSSQDEEMTYHIVSDLFYQTDFSNINLESWVDLQLFLHLGNMIDNETYKNIYYVIQGEDNAESMSFIPWDTDMSFGIYWNDGFRYMPESAEYITYRIEYEKLKEQYPELDTMMKERWKELRQTVFSNTNILSKADQYTLTVCDSGALERDFNYLGWNSWGGEDTLDGFKAYIVRRLQVLDELYQ